MSITTDTTHMSAPFILMLSFVIIHFFSKYLSLPENFQQRFISFAAGIGIAYVFIHLWPTVAETQGTVEEEIQWLSGNLLDYSVYLTALSGLVIFFSLYRLVAQTREKEDEASAKTSSVSSALFWAHIGFFSLYNLIIGILVTDRSEWNTAQFIFLTAFGLHFITNDWHLRHHHESAYDHYGRYILSVSILIGYLVGTWIGFPGYIIGIFEAFITGAMTLNVIKSELPSEKSGSLGGFLTGIAGAAFLFVLI